MTSSGMQWTKAEPGHVSQKIDTSTANVARIYDYWLGGKDNFEADRIAAEKVLTQMPGQRRSALENRRFLRRAVGFLAGEAGIDQFLDIGVGLPTQGAVHEVAHEINPRSHVAYVDYDPVVVAHGNALLATPDQSVVVQADIRRPGELLANPVIRGHLDFGRPVAVLLLAIMHFVSDDDDPAAVAASLRAALAPGSYLVLTTICQELLPDKEAAARAKDVYQKAGQPIQARSAEEIRGFFGDFELVEPGLVPKHAWRPEAGTAVADPSDISLGGVARKIA
ncbi:MAG TPA: SAM-dependent methyltransferase [Trebonia sp.]